MNKLLQHIIQLHVRNQQSRSTYIISLLVYMQCQDSIPDSLDLPAKVESHAPSWCISIEACTESSEIFTTLRGNFTSMYLIHLCQSYCVHMLLSCIGDKQVH